MYGIVDVSVLVCACADMRVLKYEAEACMPTYVWTIRLIFPIFIPLFTIHQFIQETPI